MVATLSQSVLEDWATVAKSPHYSTLEVMGQVSVTKDLTDGVSLTESTITTSVAALSGLGLEL